VTAPEGAINSTTAIPATLTYKGQRYGITIKYRGHRSLEFPKKSFTLGFSSADFEDADLGFPARKKILLVTAFDDASQIRDRLALELWKRLGTGRIQVRTAFAVLYLNGDYRGLYMMSEKISGPVFTEAGSSAAGNFYKGDTHDANWFTVDANGLPKITWHDGFSKAEGLPLDGQPGAYDDLDAFVKFVATSDAATFDAQFPTLANVDEFRDWWALVMLTVAADCTNKNGFVYHDPAGGPFRSTVWDYGSSFGQDWQTFRTPATAGGDFQWANGMWQRLLAPPFQAGTIARLHAALNQTAKADDVLAIVDRYTAEIADEAPRDEARWGAAQQAFFAGEGRTNWTGWEAEVAYLRAWIPARWSYLQTRY
jgi:spore coat protein H